MVLDLSYFSKQKLQDNYLSNYPLDIQFYSNESPALSYDECITLALERIRVLRIIISITKNNRRKSDEEIRLLIVDRLKSIKSFGYATLLNSKGHQTSSDQDLLNRISDHVSFITLTLALISSHEYYENFQLLEEKFFKLRINALDNEGLRNVLDTYNQFPKITDSEKEELRPKLVKLLQKPKDYEEIEFFKVPISYVLGMVNPHDIHFSHGLAFIPFYMMKQVMRAKFRHCLNERISSLDFKILRRFKHRFTLLRPALHNIRSNFKEMQMLVEKESGLTAEDVDPLSRRTFPPCMRVIHENFRKNHHLKHESRLQFTLFLKGIGLPVAETLKLFKNEFTKKIDVEIFEKEYKYYIEHAYGLRGSKIDYDPKNCAEIQEIPTSLGDCNGCPLKISHITDIEDLDKTLSQWKIPSSDKQNIIEESKRGNCGSACAHYFQAINGFTLNEVIEHPNEFFMNSRFAQSHCLPPLPRQEERSIVESRPDKTFVIQDFAIIKSNDSEKVNGIDSNNLTPSQIENNVVDNKKRKVEEAFDNRETKVPDVNKKVKTEQIEAVKVLNDHETPALELIAEEEVIDANKLDILQVSDDDDTPPQELSPEEEELLDAKHVKEENDEMAFLKLVSLGFDDIIPIENVKTGAVIHAPRRSD